MQVAHDPVAQTFTAVLDGELAGALYYRESRPGEWQMYSTRVPTRFEGRGVGSALARAAVETAVAGDKRVDPTCWFVAGWIDRHPEVLVKREESDVLTNREYWDSMAPQWVAAGERQWLCNEPNWGIWHAPETELRLLPESLEGLQTVELGCGTGYVSGWLARRGAEAVGLDNSAQQLATAQRLSREHGVAVGWVHGNAERLPFEAESFDLAVTEYGAVTWVDPVRWVPEAARVLRPGGRLVVLGNTPWLNVCTPTTGATAGRQLERSYFGEGRIDWTDAPIDPGGVEFNLPISGWFELFTVNALRVERYLEIQAPEGVEDQTYVTADWARMFPAEHAWVVTRH